VHVFAGGGSGELLMRALADAGTPFTAGPLNVGDSDYTLAERLAVATLVEPPYAPISAQGVAATREALSAACAVIVCPAPLGHGNLTLLDLALETRKAGGVVLLLEPGKTADARMSAVASRDYTGRGMALYAALEAVGARWAHTPQEVLALLHGLAGD
jgi:iron complex transport system ATP-binding protein